MNMTFQSDLFCSDIKRNLPNHFEWLIFLKVFGVIDRFDPCFFIYEAFSRDPLFLPPHALPHGENLH